MHCVDPEGGKGKPRLFITKSVANRKCDSTSRPLVLWNAVKCVHATNLFWIYYVLLSLGLDCKKSVRCEQMELPEDFTVDHFTAIRNRGYFIFFAVPSFETFCIIESIIQTHI